MPNSSRVKEEEEFSERIIIERIIRIYLKKNERQTQQKKG